MSRLRAKCVVSRVPKCEAPGAPKYREKVNSRWQPGHPPGDTPARLTTRRTSCCLLLFSAGMLLFALTRSIVGFAFLLGVWNTSAQNGVKADQAEAQYRLQLPVDEVVLTFHAVDHHGLPVKDLKLNEVRLRDNSSPPRRIIAFDSIVDRPIRAAILVDTSDSMQHFVQESKHIAERFAEGILRQRSDQRTVIDFAYASNTAARWTADPSALFEQIQNVRLGAMSPVKGTAILNTIFRTCAYGFKNADPTSTGNSILLFSDGEDNASMTSMEEALRACQSSNTVVYAFRIPSSDAKSSTGPKTLADLAANTGGQVFPADESPDAIGNDLKTIESEMRNQYRLIYTPASLKHDGSFHSIELQLPDRVDKLEVRSGYFAARK